MQKLSSCIDLLTCFTNTKCILTLHPNSLESLSTLLCYRGNKGTNNTLVLGFIYKLPRSPVMTN